MEKSAYSILVNTCDKFEDCWNPFFKLFKMYWPDYAGKIYLNTEYKNFTYEGLNIISLKVCEEKKDAHKITWSECLKRALNSVEEDTILYMQEDYFLKNFVKNDIVTEFVDLMQDNPIDCIHLTDQAVLPDKISDKYNRLYNVILKQRYRVSCQAALWKKDVLSSYIRTYESAWQFEEFGSERGVILNHNFYVVDRGWVKMDYFEIIPYVFTGVVQGRWYEEVVPLFTKHNIIIDFSNRGFVSEAPKRPLKVKLLNRLKRLPIFLKHYYDLRILGK